MVKSVDTADLKSAGPKARRGSSPLPGIDRKQSETGTYADLRRDGASAFYVSPNCDRWVRAVCKVTEGIGAL